MAKSANEKKKRLHFKTRLPPAARPRNDVTLSGLQKEVGVLANGDGNDNGNVGKQLKNISLYNSWNSINFDHQLRRHRPILVPRAFSLPRADEYDYTSPGDGLLTSHRSEL